MDCNECEAFSNELNGLQEVLAKAFGDGEVDYTAYSTMVRGHIDVMRELIPMCHMYIKHHNKLKIMMKDNGIFATPPRHILRKTYKHD